MEQYTCCFTGHRDIPPQKRKAVAAALEKVVEGLIAAGYRQFATGGALGFDTMAALCVLGMKKRYPGIRLLLVLPCLDQSLRWPAADVRMYEQIKALADRVEYVDREYTPGCMLKRNRRLVDMSQVCIAYLKKATGGTAYTVDYARKRGVRVIFLRDQL